MPDVSVLPPDPAALWAALDPAQRGTLRHVAAAAAGGAVYLVGGPVRDLLLGATRLRDIDAMTTTDARVVAPTFAGRVGGTVEKTTAFGTATVTLPAGSDPPSLDLATTRTETYAHPGALPTVTFPAPTVEDDLRRRDFTINAMALPLTPDGFGTLLDPYGGYGDLRNGLLRVLHDASFRDDPTRLFRLVRYSARYGIRFEEHTGNLAVEAVRTHALATVSPARKRREIELGMREHWDTDCLAQFYMAGLLQETSPVFVWEPATLFWSEAMHFVDRVDMGHKPWTGEHAPEWAMWAGFVVKRGEAAMTRLFADVALNEGEMQTPIRLLVRAYAAYAAGDVTPETPSSALAPLFERVPEWAVPVFFPPEVAGSISALHERLREHAATPHLRGNEIQDLGVKRGPETGEMVKTLRAAWLDGKVDTLEDEARFVRERVTDEDTSSLCK